jgi:hypothetical protein
MDGYTVEIDELQDDLVVLVVPALRLLVFGRTLNEAMRRAGASIDFRVLDGGPRPDRLIRADQGLGGSKAKTVAA